jgi:uncharacterized membrane protein YdbT with pleckstrin-like domain
MSYASDYVKSDEQVLEVIRRHWINVLPAMVGWIIMALLGLYGFYILGRYQGLESNGSPLIFGGLGLVAVMVLALLFAYVSFWVYRQNFIIVTDKNLYQITQNSLFSRTVAQFNLERLQDVAASQNGFLATILDYGDIIVETAGEDRSFKFSQVARPRYLAERIMDCHRDAVAASGQTQSQP